MKEARGSLIAYQQDDDLWLHDHLERLVNIFDRRKTGWVHSRSFWVQERGLIIPHYANATIGMAHSRIVNRANMIASSMVMHPVELLDVTGGWDVSGEPGADWRLWKEMLAQQDEWPARCQPVPSALHLNSRFKDDDKWPSFLSNVTAQSNRNFWPKALRLGGNRDRREQLWDKTSTNPEGYANQLRAGFTSLEQNILWGFSLGKL